MAIQKYMANLYHWIGILQNILILGNSVKKLPNVYPKEPIPGVDKYSGTIISYPSLARQNIDNQWKPKNNIFLTLSTWWLDLLMNIQQNNSSGI